MIDPTGHEVEPPDMDPEFEDDMELELEEDLVEEDDFSDLDDMVAEGMRQTQEEKALKAARKRLQKVAKSSHESAARERVELLALIRKLEEGRVWITAAGVALFKTQTCEACGAKHSFFEGWFTEQKHATDPNARRLLAGKPVEQLPERREDHHVNPDGLVPLCSNCVEQWIAIDVASGQATEE